ncbi:MAG: hypothetical protein ACRDKL_10055 [Solirubrobacteraceae bacterium]
MSKQAVLELGGSAIVLWVIAVVLLLFAISRFSRARHAADQQHKQAAARHAAAEHASAARTLAGQLDAGEAPDFGQVWDVVLSPGERPLFEGLAGYSRYYGLGSQAGYTHVSTRHSGNVTGALVDHALVSAGSKARAQGAAFAAAARWRDHQQARLLVTDRRLVCEVQAKGWVNFDHAAATAIRAVPETRSVVLEYPEAAPLCLSGPATAQVMVVVIWALYGSKGLREHPALAEVRAVAPFPEAAASDPTPTEDAVVSVTARPDLLALVAAHELLLAEDAARLVGVSEQEATERLTQLIDEGLVWRVRVSVDAPIGYRITEQGVAQVGATAALPDTLDLAGYANVVTATAP